MLTQIRKLDETTRTSLDEFCSEFRNPRHVSDIWESIGTLSCRLTDMQTTFDDLLGIKKMKSSRAQRDTPEKSTPKK